MGYESRLYIVNEHTNITDGSVYSAEKIAMLNMCKMDYEVVDIFTNESTAELWGDEDAELTYDKYGDHIRSATIEEVITAMEEANNKSHYRRYDVALSLLKSFLDKDNWQRENIKVYHYGY